MPVDDYEFIMNGALTGCTSTRERNEVSWGLNVLPGTLILGLKSMPTSFLPMSRILLSSRQISFQKTGLHLLWVACLFCVFRIEKTRRIVHLSSGIGSID